MKTGLDVLIGAWTAVFLSACLRLEVASFNSLFFWDFSTFVFLIFVFLDTFWTREGFQRVQGWITLHLDQVSAQIDHS